MIVQRNVLAFAAGAALVGLVAWAAFHAYDGRARAEREVLRERVETAEQSLGRSTVYRDYIAEGKRALSGQAKFVAATVARPYTIARGVETRILGVPSKGAIVVSYTVEYAFGYDLGPAAFDIVDTPAGIEIRVARPQLVAQPAVGKLGYTVLASGLWSDEKLAALRLYEEASTFAQAEGVRLQDDPAIVAMCERQLVAFLRDFLARQPRVTQVPAITVTYRAARHGTG
jgi:hypothetical protein